MLDEKQEADNLMRNTPFSAPRWLIDWIDRAAMPMALNRSVWLRQAALEKLERDGVRRPDNAPVEG